VVDLPDCLARDLAEHSLIHSQISKPLLRSTLLM
jgi:hypothetical protein